VNKTVSIALWIGFGFAVAALAIIYYDKWIGEAIDLVNSILGGLQDY